MGSVLAACWFLTALTLARRFPSSGMAEVNLTCPNDWPDSCCSLADRCNSRQPVPIVQVRVDSRAGCKVCNRPERGVCRQGPKRAGPGPFGER